MNKNAKKRIPGQWSQGNSLYLTLYYRPTKQVIKLPLDYGLSDIQIDADLDKMAFMYENREAAGQHVSVIALYDINRIVMIQIDESSLINQPSFNEGSSRHSSNSSLRQAQGGRRSPFPKLKTKVIYFTDILEPMADKSKQTDFQNIVQQVHLLGNKLYLWNENVFRILEIKFSIDLDSQMQTLQEMTRVRAG